MAVPKTKNPLKKQKPLSLSDAVFYAPFLHSAIFLFIALSYTAGVYNYPAFAAVGGLLLALQENAFPHRN